jgi:hypothetical protein
LGLEQLIDGVLGLRPEGIGVRDHHLHALSLEIQQDGPLAGLDLVVGPLFRLLTSLDDEVLVRLGQLVEKRLVDQNSRGLNKMIGDDQMALDLVKLEGLDLWQVPLGSLGLARLERAIELGQRYPNGVGTDRLPDGHPTGNGWQPQLEVVHISGRVEGFLCRRLPQSPVDSRQVLQVVLL